MNSHIFWQIKKFHSFFEVQRFIRLPCWLEICLWYIMQYWHALLFIFAGWICSSWFTSQSISLAIIRDSRLLSLIGLFKLFQTHPMLVEDSLWPRLYSQQRCFCWVWSVKTQRRRGWGSRVWPGNRWLRKARFGQLGVWSGRLDWGYLWNCHS